MSNGGGGGDLSRACDLGFFPGTFGSKMLLSSGSGVRGPGSGVGGHLSHEHFREGWRGSE